MLAASAMANPRPVPTVRHYRIDASITAFGATIFSRRHVGFALAQLAVHSTDRGRDISFSIMGSSLPERTRGILQLGHFEEELREAAGRLETSRYFGFLTAAPEGQRSIPSRPPSTCCAVEGSLDPTRFRFRKTYEAALPPTSGTHELSHLRRHMRDSLDRICANSCLNGNSEPTTNRTFLKTLLEAMESPNNCMETDYHYGDRVLRFRSRKTAGAAALSSFEADVQGRGRHRFALYYRPAAPAALPEKVEYWPRPWLKLTLLPADAPSMKETT